MPYLTVIIATKNRSRAIAEIALPSLLRQEGLDFDVSVWDASDDELTKDAVRKFIPAFTEKGVDLIYTRAPRAGSASQRNDAARAARGEAVFFMDDDSELAADAVSTAAKYFRSFEWLKGMALPLIQKTPSPPRRQHGVLRFIKTILPLSFERNISYRYVRDSTGHIGPRMDVPGTADWLGGCVAYRRSLFDEMEFDERLERFGGYAWGEDADFSHRVLLRYGAPLIVAAGSHVVHHNAESGVRPADKWRQVAMYCYNTSVIRENFNKYKTYPLLPFLTEHRIWRFFAMWLGGISARDIFRGYREYRKARRE